MPKFTVTHEIHCDVDTFWKLFFDQAFNEAMYKQGLHFPEFRVLEQRETDREIVRKVAGQPKMDMPGPVAKVLGSGFRYTEEGTFDKATRTWRWKMTPSTMADKLRQEGTLRVEPAGEGRVRRVAELVNEAKIFGIGGMLEGFAEKSLRQGWDDSARFMNGWISEGKAR